MTAKEYLKGIGKKECESIHGMTNEYLVTPEEIEEYASRRTQDVVKEVVVSYSKDVRAALQGNKFMPTVAPAYWAEEWIKKQTRT